MTEFAQHFRHFVLDDLARQAFGDGGLADARIADEQRIVLRAAAEDLDRALDLGVAPDQRIDAAGLRLLVQVDAIGFERLGALLVLLLVASSSSSEPRAVFCWLMPGRLAMPWLM